MGVRPWIRRAGNNVICINQQSAREWTKLIRKLRWIGLEEEALRLELAASTLPPEERGSESVGSFSAD
jgi:hypothetical protein